ncbi:hypothetical protein [Hymenobacter daecheongensis]|nr:hypothetical protein [Hymenobacter daecheongensis]
MNIIADKGKKQAPERLLNAREKRFSVPFCILCAFEGKKLYMDDWLNQGESQFVPEGRIKFVIFIKKRLLIAGLRILESYYFFIRRQMKE